MREPGVLGGSVREAGVPVDAGRTGSGRVPAGTGGMGECGSWGSRPDLGDLDQWGAGGPGWADTHMGGFRLTRVPGGLVCTGVRVDGEPGACWQAGV